MSRALLVALSLVAASGSAFAQESVVPSRLSLDEALRLAHERSPSLGAVKNGVESAEAGRLDARLRPNPAFTLDTENYPLFEANRPGFVNNQQLTARVDQEIEMAGRRRLRMAAADVSVAAAQATLADAERRLDLDVRSRYLAIVLAKADVDVAQSTLNEIDQLIALNRARYEQGEISGVEVRRIQVERLRFVEDVFTAQLSVRNAQSALLALMNAPDLSVQFDVTESLSPAPGQIPALPPAPDAVALQRQALETRPDLLASRRDADRASTETRLQRALRTPNVTVGGGYQRNFGANAFVLGVTVPLPLWNRNQGGVARAVAEESRARNLASASGVTVQLEVQQALNGVAISRERVNYIEREYLTPARESRDIVLQSYRLGTATLLDYLDAQRAFRDTLRTYNRALFDQRLSLFQLGAATGGASTTQVSR